MGFVGLAVARREEDVLRSLLAKASGTAGVGGRARLGRDRARTSFLDGGSLRTDSMTIYICSVE